MIISLFVLRTAPLAHGTLLTKHSRPTKTKSRGSENDDPPCFGHENTCITLPSRPTGRCISIFFEPRPTLTGKKDRYYDRRDGLKLDDDFGDEASFSRFSQNIMAKKEDTRRVEWTTQENFLTVFYDGGCSLCRREINFYKRLQQKQLGSALGDTQHKESFIDFYNIYKTCTS